MAILYGTTATGETLPVEVNEFGQLVAEGLPGPPGPPGIGELPPDPFEGAVLGWKDNKLSWLGGSVPLPPGTYGPITAYQGGVLTLASEVDLPYLAQFFLSNELGGEVIWTPTTSLISNVLDNVLTLTDDTNLANFRVGDVVQGGGVLNTTVTGGPWQGSQSATTVAQVISVGGNINTNYSGNYFWSTLEFDPPIQGNEFKFYVEAGCTIRNDSNNQLATSSGTGYLLVPSDGTGLLSSVSFSVNGSQGQVTGPYVDGVLTTNAVEIDQLNATASYDIPVIASITAINEAPPSITTDGGNWSGTDGTGVSDGERTVVGPEIMGQGSVQAVIGNTIILREDNGGWKLGEFITAPSQALAARYVYSDEIRKKLL